MATKDRLLRLEAASIAHRRATGVPVPVIWSGASGWVEVT